MKKMILKIVTAVLLLALVYGAGWFAWSRTKYGAYIDGMEKSVFYTIMTPRYDSFGKNGYDFGVKYPDAFSFTGNLSVGRSGEGFTDALIVWPKIKGSYEYGVILFEDETMYQIEIDRNGMPLDAEFDLVVKRHTESIHALLQQARRQWTMLT